MHVEPSQGVPCSCGLFIIAKGEIRARARRRKRGMKIDHFRSKDGDQGEVVGRTRLGRDATVEGPGMVAGPTDGASLEAFCWARLTCRWPRLTSRAGSLLGCRTVGGPVVNDWMVGRAVGDVWRWLNRVGP